MVVPSNPDSPRTYIAAGSQGSAGLKISGRVVSNGDKFN